MGETTNNKSTTTEPKKDTKNCITKHILNTTPIHTMLASMCQQHQNHCLITNSSQGHQCALMAKYLPKISLKVVELALRLPNL